MFYGHIIEIFGGFPVGLDCGYGDAYCSNGCIAHFCGRPWTFRIGGGDPHLVDSVGHEGGDMKKDALLMVTKHVVATSEFEGPVEHTHDIIEADLPTLADIILAARPELRGKFELPEVPEMWHRPNQKTIDRVLEDIGSHTEVVVNEDDDAIERIVEKVLEDIEVGDVDDADRLLSICSDSEVEEIFERMSEEEMTAGLCMKGYIPMEEGFPSQEDFPTRTPPVERFVRGEGSPGTFTVILPKI